jgi:hypothetical protein
LVKAGGGLLERPFLWIAVHAALDGKEIKKIILIFESSNLS